MNEFLKLLANELMPTIVRLVGVGISILITYLFTKYIKGKISSTEYAKFYNIAKSCWNIVDENFRTQVNTCENKVNEFEYEILKKIPGLSEDDITHFRQAIAGEVNKFRNDIKPVTVDTDKVTTFKENKEILDYYYKNANNNF